MAVARRYQETEKKVYTEDEYLDFERTSSGRWEYVNGQIRAMSGGSADHSTIAMNIGATLRSALLPKGCRVLGSDMKVHTNSSTNTFPDISVVCGLLTFHRGRKDIITNPILVVEVLSSSTEAYDRGEKFLHYQTIPSLTDYLLVSQDDARVQLFTCEGDRWQPHEVTGRAGEIYLPSVDMTLALSDVYALVELPPDPADANG